jgi:ABC-2 type transport system ATP-binding protein
MPSDASGAMIRTVDVRVDYDDLTAVAALDLSIGPGEVFGLIGPNGAGKTSTIRVLATLLEPTYGEVYVGGFDVAERPDEVHRILGYMPDLAPVPDDLKVWEFLDLYAAAHFIGRRDRRHRVDACIEMVDLQGKRNAMAGTLSRGMTQRLVLAKTLLHDPTVMLLDEPASGLDPLARIELRKLLTRLASEGKTVLISSHILTELSGFCTSIGIMEKGRLVESGRISDILTRVAPRRRYVVEVLDDPATVRPLLDARAGVSAVLSTDHRLELEFAGDDADAARLLAELVGHGVRVKTFHEQRLGVEDILLRVGAREVS